MSFATVRRYIMLVLLFTFIAYFGVWKLYYAMIPMLGEIGRLCSRPWHAPGLGLSRWLA